MPFINKPKRILIPCLRKIFLTCQLLIKPLYKPLKVSKADSSCLELFLFEWTIEYLNNHIKVLKRNAYGFRNFYNFKLRILVQQEQAIQTK